MDSSWRSLSISRVIDDQIASLALIKGIRQSSDSKNIASSKKKFNLNHFYNYWCAGMLKSTAPGMTVCESEFYRGTLTA